MAKELRGDMFLISNAMRKLQVSEISSDYHTMICFCQITKVYTFTIFIHRDPMELLVMLTWKIFASSWMSTTHINAMEISMKTLLVFKKYVLTIYLPNKSRP